MERVGPLLTAERPVAEGVLGSSVWRRAYRRQVELYARAWESMTGEPVNERVLCYTVRPEEDAEERWWGPGSRSRMIDGPADPWIGGPIV